jgi:CRISPR/Cas system-associated exonuclease Cas4 (RecB family)
VTATSQLLDRALAADFRGWYRERQRRQRAREGRFEYNGPRDSPPADVHFPHTLLTCHRTQRYDEQNAPAEEPAALGHFRMGTEVETELVLPFLEERVAGEEYVTNGIGFEATIETDSGRYRLRGRTDPVITTRDGTPRLPTEVKTSEDIETLDAPRETHRAQLHAYLVALSEQYATPVHDGLLLYVSKSTLALRAFHVGFDETFWTDRVVPWLAALTTEREAESLPPASPEQDWECGWCDYRRRCGQTEDPVADAGPVGFVPGHEYPRAAVLDHLQAHEVPLTPTLAARYPDLADTHPTVDWRCPVCGSERPPATGDGDGETGYPPSCPECERDGEYVQMEGPRPDGW